MGPLQTPVLKIQRVAEALGSQSPHFQTTALLRYSVGPVGHTIASSNAVTLNSIVTAADMPRQASIQDLESLQFGLLSRKLIEATTIWIYSK